MLLNLLVRLFSLSLLLCPTIIFADAEATSKEDIAESSILLPSFLQEVNSPIALSEDSIFYNQRLEKKTLENFDNRFIIVHFWASWCMDCHSELIALNKLQKDFRKKALSVVVISEDFKGLDTIDQFFTKHKIDYLDIYIDKKNSVYKALKIQHLPASYLIDFNGKVIASSIPGVVVDWHDEDLRKFLDDKVSAYQLLPPEYKSIREKYEPVIEEVKEVIKPKKQEKSKIFIN